MTSLLLRCLQVPGMRAETWCVDGYPENLNGVFWNMLLRSEPELGVVELFEKPSPSPFAI